MTWNGIRRRVEALEQRDPPVKRWHAISVAVGDTPEAARARYEAEHGPIGENDGLIVREYVRPQPETPR